MQPGSYYLNLRDNLFSLLFGGIVGFPLVSHPQGVVGCWPLLDLPPCGWSTGFLAIPRTTGLNPQCLTKPALAIRTLICPEFDTTPKDTKQSSFNHIFHPDFNFKRTRPPIFFKTVANEPAARQTFAP